MDEDLGLLQRWRGGDGPAGQALFAKHFPDVFRFFQHKLGPDADELTQRTFTACVAAKDRFRADSTFRTYLYAIARNQLYSYLRALPKGERVDFEETSIADLVTSLSSRIGKLRQIEQLRAALAALPAEQQLLLELHYWHDLDAAALAEVFEIPAGTVRVRLLRARKALRNRMGSIDAGGAAVDGLLAALSRPDSEDPE